MCLLVKYIHEYLNGFHNYTARKAFSGEKKMWCGLRVDETLALALLFLTPCAVSPLRGRESMTDAKIRYRVVMLIPGWADLKVQCVGFRGINRMYWQCSNHHFHVYITIPGKLRIVACGHLTMSWSTLNI